MSVPKTSMQVKNFKTMYSTGGVNGCCIFVVLPKRNNTCCRTCSNMWKTYYSKTKYFFKQGTWKDVSTLHMSVLK